MDRALELTGAVVAPVVLCLSASGLALAEKIAPAIGADIHGLASRCPEAAVTFSDTVGHIADIFVSGRPIIGVCATAILIRAVAPYVQSKHEDAAVLAVAEDGSAIVPLLGLHHRALNLARQIESVCGGTVAMTTPGSLGDAVALDMPPAGWRLANPEATAPVMATVLAGGGACIEFGDQDDAVEKWLSPVRRGTDVTLTFDHRAVSTGKTHLVYCPQSFILGIGCARGCDAAVLDRFVQETLAAHRVNPASIAAVASVDLKGDEPAIIALAARLEVPFRVFSSDELLAETQRVANPSQTVFDEIGTYSVAEAAALATGGQSASLFIEKQKSDQATLAVARLPHPLQSAADLSGRRPGRVMLIGIGPGKGDWRTPEASKWVQTADEVVGYGLYIDLIGPSVSHIPRRDFALGEEEARCRYALEEAAKGRHIAIICSGDAGIYAMGALVFELLDRASDKGGVSPAARRVEVLSSPGVSALQAAAARSGAILGHDFCTISLSDLLTPWAQIEARIHAAGAGDFVIAFYNPVSRRRRHQLAAARDILVTYRGAGVPVVLASNLGRPDEALTYCTLGALSVDDVDMLTVVMVGSSASKLLNLGRCTAVYTPRGYDKKQ